VILAAEGVTARRGGRTVLDGVSFRAGAGEFIAVIGPNGAGKSTLLSLLAGLSRPDAGQVLLDGAPLPGPQAWARRRAYLPQNPHLEWPLPVTRLVALGLTPHLPGMGPLPASFDPAIAAALRQTDLEDRAEQPATTLSGGEFARAMLARALVGTPEVLIVDEPIAGLDPRHAMSCMALLSERAAAGTLVIAALHDLSLAARHAARVLALKDGRLAHDGGLTAEMVETVFDVTAKLRGQGADISVDLLPGQTKTPPG
jgi:iron complex transport system ATP-binding protein